MEPGGFKCFRREVLEAIPLGEVRSNGYAFQIEMSFRAWKKKFRITEIPIVFPRPDGRRVQNVEEHRSRGGVDGLAAPLLVTSKLGVNMSAASTLQGGDLFRKLVGIPFVKMTGSGNDFVMFDSRKVDGALVTQPEAIRAICNRYNGIGADGVVLLEPNAHSANAQIHYFNSDGSAADLCGNATLCSTAMAVDLAIGLKDGLTLWTDAGLIHSRIRNDLPEIDLAPAKHVRVAVDVELGVGEKRVWLCCHWSSACRCARGQRRQR